MKIVLAYNHVSNPEHYPFDYAYRFVSSFHCFPPGADHRVIVIASGGSPSPQAEALFSSLKPEFYHTDDVGWDIGNYIKLARTLDCDMLAMFGGSSHFRRAGWLRRMQFAWERFGPGFYGSIGTFEVAPYLLTTGIWTFPELLAGYPNKVITRRDRYDFEHGPDCMHVLAAKMRVPVKLVTWDGFYDLPHWRIPPNIYRRGDQSNCLCFSNRSDQYETSDAIARMTMERLADTRVI